MEQAGIERCTDPVATGVVGKKEEAAAVGLVTCALFPQLTGDDRLLYRALGETLAPPPRQAPASGTRGAVSKRGGGAHRQRAMAGQAIDDASGSGVASGPVRIVQWNDPSVDWTSLRLCVIRSPWDYTQRYAEWLAWLDSTVDRASEEATTSSSSPSSSPPAPGPVFLPDAATLRWNGHKRYLLDLERRGIPVVPTRLLERGHDDFEKVVDEIARRNEWGCDFCIVKPAVGSFGNDVTMIKLSSNRQVSRDDASVKVMKRMNQMLGEQDLLVQPFLASVKTKGEVSLIFIEGEFVHAIKKRPTQGDFKVQGGKIERHAATEDELELAQAAIHASVEAIYTPSRCSSFYKALSQADGDLAKIKEKAKPHLGRDKRPQPRSKDQRRLLLCRVDLLRENAGRLVVSEVEALDPELFFRLSDHCTQRLAQAIAQHIPT